MRCPYCKSRKKPYQTMWEPFCYKCVDCDGVFSVVETPLRETIPRRLRLKK